MHALPFREVRSICARKGQREALKKDYRVPPCPAQARGSIMERGVDGIRREIQALWGDELRGRWPCAAPVLDKVVEVW